MLPPGQPMGIHQKWTDEKIVKNTIDASIQADDGGNTPSKRIHSIAVRGFCFK